MFKKKTIKNLIIVDWIWDISVVRIDLRHTAASAARSTAEDTE